MALFYECMLKCARKLLDTADIAREAMFQQESALPPSKIAALEAAAISAVRSVDFLDNPRFVRARTDQRVSNETTCRSKSNATPVAPRAVGPSKPSKFRRLRSGVVQI